MNLRCENCGHMALDTDANCWHCGEPLPGRESAARQKVKVRESWSRGAGPASLVAYGGLTLLVVLAALLTMRSLGQEPQLQVRLGTRPRPEWTLITAADRRFTVTLPNSWAWIDGTDPAAAGALQAVIRDDPRLQSATHPLGAETDDATILFAAEGPASPSGQAPFMVVAGSDLLNRLTYAEAVTFLLGSDYNLQQARHVDNFDKSHVSIIVTTPLGDQSSEEIRCRQQFVLGRQESLIASLCAPAGRYAAYTAQFDEILASFQHLGT